MAPSVLIIGDLHLRDSPPRNATETYVDDLFELLEWCFDHAVEQGITTVISAGDVFDHKVPARTSHALMIRMSRILVLAQQRGIDFWIVLGNHDLTADVVESAREKQPIGVLFESGLAKELSGWHPDLPIYGIPWQQRWHQEGIVDEVFDRWRQPPRDAQLSESLVITHCPIYPPKQVENVPFEVVHASEIAKAMGGAGSLYYGHIHEDHGFFEVDGVTFGNVGALSRGSIHEYNLSRDIQVTRWDPTTGFTAVPIPIAKPAEEVFRLQEALIEKVTARSRADFLSDLGGRTLEIASKESVIHAISGMEHVAPRVRTTAVDILEEIDA